MKNIAIVGGGLAGLTCAHALQQRGIPSIVFEAESGAGGRCDAAAYLLGPDVYTDTFRLAASLGLEHDLLEIQPIAGQFYKGRIYHHRVSSVTGLLGFKGLNIADKTLLSRMAYFLARYSAKLDLHHPERGVSLDDETTAGFVKRELSQNILNYVAGPLISTLFYYSSEETSRLLYLNIAKYMYNIRMFTIRGGIGRIADRLAQGVTIEQGRRVESIVGDGAGYLVNGRAFSDVVLAVPGTAVLGIGGVDDLLDAQDREFFANCKYGRAVAVTVEATRPLDRCYALSIPRVERRHAAAIVHHDFIDPSTTATGHHVTIIGGGDSVTAEQLLHDFAHIYRVTPHEFTWREWTSAMPKFPPGRFREVASFVSRHRRPGLSFCGDYLLGPFIEAAVTTGLTAAKHCKN